MTVQGCLLVYDVTNRAGFESLEHWLNEAQQFGAENTVSYLVEAGLVRENSCYVHAVCLPSIVSIVVYIHT